MSRLHFMAAMSTLLPGLPDNLLVDQIIPRIPWYARPISRSLSKAWRSLLDAPDPTLEAKTREFQLPLLKDLAVVCTYSDFNHRRSLAAFLQNAKGSNSWIKLPEVPLFVLGGRPQVVAWSGMIFVWSVTKGGFGRNVIAKLDIGRGKIVWDLRPVRGAAGWNDTVAFKGKLYSEWSPKNKFLVGKNVRTDVKIYDMENDGCYTIAGKWDVNSVGITRNVVSMPSCSSSNASPTFVVDESMYGFAVDWARYAVNLMRYNELHNEWKVQEELPEIPLRGSGLSTEGFNVVNGSCFNPPVESSVNVILHKEEQGELMSWCNMRLGKGWVSIEDKLLGGGKMKDLLVVHGDVFAVSKEDHDERPFFREWVIWKGEIYQSSSSNYIEWKRINGMPITSRKVLDEAPTKTVLCYTLQRNNSF